MRITKISVKGLFGMFDHEIPLNQESRITIVHGPNGVGKTVLQQLIHGLFKYDFVFLGTTPFEELRVEFAGGEFVTVEKLDPDKKLTIQYFDGTEIDYVPFNPPIFDTKGLMEAVEDHFPFLGLVMKEGEPHWIFRDTIDFYEGRELELEFPFGQAELSGLIGELFADKADIFRWYYGLGPDDLERHTGSQEGPFGEEPEWFVHLTNRAHAYFIQTQRLLSDISGGFLFVNKSKQIPGYAYYVPNPKPSVVYFAERFQDRLRWAHESAANLEHVGRLVGMGRTFELFQDIINERVLFKSMSIKDYEFRFVADNGRDVPLSALSSGEQHLFTLYYYLIFESHPGMLVMIDEPELSLNVVWQRKFTQYLERIIELRDFDVLIATHSPQIITDKWDWMVALGYADSDYDNDS